jgi:Immune inhibitor A peptidase M6
LFRKRRNASWRGRRAAYLAAAFLLLVTAAIAWSGAAAAGDNAELLPAKKYGPSPSSVGRGGIIHLGPDVARRYPVKIGNKLVPFRKALKLKSRLRKQSRLYRSKNGTRRALRPLSHGNPVPGEVRRWFALDNQFGFFYGKNFTFRGMGDKIEVWVASEANRRAPADPRIPIVPGTPGQSSGTDFMDGDCRNGARTTITDAQVNYLIDQFDHNIYPIESAVFSVKPSRNGTGGFAPDPRYHPQGEGDNVVVLIDNVRDENFYDFNNTQAFSYIAGFYSSGLDDLFNRTIMTIDAFDWLHRTGANPPHEPVPGNNCTSAPARPFLYEGVFAHEYQHLLEQYEDPDEVTWVNEGLSDHAQTLTGYVDPSRPITEIGFDGHTQCFLGYLGVQTFANPNPRDGGPENSLTLWGDQGDDEILCDYGAVYTSMEYYSGQFGLSFMTRLHRDDANGLTGLQDALNTFAPGETTGNVLHRWSMMVAIDALLNGRRKLEGGLASRYRTPTLNASINWDTTHAYDTPGAPPNGSDYVRLRDGAGRYVRLNDIEELRFDGASTIPPRPIQWSVDANPPGQPGDPALYSGTGDNRDEAIVRSMSVPTGAGATLTFDARWNLEEDAGGPWDFAFVQISTDGGNSYKSLSCTDTRTDHNPGAIPIIVANLPGFSGDSAGFRPQVCSLAAYAGQNVLLSLRTINDPATQGTDPTIPPGFWVDDLAVGGTVLSDGTTLAGWQSPTQVNPIRVSGFTVQLLAYKTKGKSPVRIGTVRLNSNFDGVLDRDQLEDVLGKSQADFVGAIVMYDEPTETIGEYAPYRLLVETRRGGATLQPGGS